MFGSKTAGGALEPLQLFNGNSFNKITWNTTGNNTVVASQLVLGTTPICQVSEQENKLLPVLRNIKFHLSIIY